MKVYYCPVPNDEFKAGNNGAAYIADHTEDWVDGTELLSYLSTGYVKGCDYWIHDGKVYMIVCSFMNTDQNYVCHACVEDVQVRRNGLTPEQFSKLQSM